MSQSELRIVPAGPADVGIVLRMIRGLAEYEKLAHLATATEEELREALFGPRPWAEAAIGFVDGEAAGVAVYFHTFSTFTAAPGMYLEDLYVEPRFRGLGLGKALMAHVAGLAVERGCRRLEWAALDWNELAIGFYRGLGARQLDEWKAFRLSDEPLARLAAARSE